MKRTSYLVVCIAFLIVLSAGSSQISARSGNPCSACHGGYYQYLDILEGDVRNQIPTTVNVGETKNVTLVIQNLSNAASFTMISNVSATLRSQNGHFSIKASNFYIGNFPLSEKIATWQITGTSSGTDNLLITAQGLNTHRTLSFSDSYTPSPSITVAQLSSIAPVITLTAPSGGETWLAGSIHNVTWVAGGGTGALSIKLDYSASGNGGPWTNIADNEPNDGTFLWISPNVTSTSFYVRATVVDSAIPPRSSSSANSAPFTITTKLVPTISITRPFLGLVWSGGSTHAIIWSSNGKDIGNCQVTLSYSTDNFDESNKPIASLIPDTGSYNWTPPIMNSASVRIRAVMRDSSGQTRESVSEPFMLDSTAPRVVSVKPSDGLVNINTSATLSVTFSEKVVASTAEQAFSIYPVTNALSWSWDSQQRTMTANVLLSPNTTYTSTIDAGVTDLSDPGNTNQAFSWSFTTGVNTGSAFMKSGQAPVIILDIREPQIFVNETATFDASRTFDPDNDALVFSWDFGDNTHTVESGNPVEVHSFASDGKYNILLKVNDGTVESMQAMEISVRKPQTTTANAGNSLDWHVVWGGFVLSIVGIIGVGRSAFTERTDPLTITTTTEVKGTRGAPCISSVLSTLLLRTENCVGCGLCARKCPINAITIIDKRPVHDPSKCRSCMACVKGCARGAISVTAPVAQIAPVA